MSDQVRVVPFAELGKTGKHGLVRYLLSFTLFIGVGFGISLGIMFALATLAQISFEELVSQLRTSGDDRDLMQMLIVFVAAMSSVFSFLFSARLFFPLIHRRAWRTYLTAAKRFRYREFWVSFWVLILLLAIASYAAYLFDPNALEYVFDPTAFFFFLPAVLLLVPLQVLAEEVVFRGYLLQAVGERTGSFLARLIIPGVLFGLLHGANPEVDAGGLIVLWVYVGIGLYLGLLTLWSNGLEHAIGVHLANNLFGISIIGYASSAIAVPTVFFDPSTAIDPDEILFTLALFAVHFVIVYAISQRSVKLDIEAS